MFKLPNNCTHFELCSKSFKLGFSSMWTENFQLYKLGLQGAEEKNVKLNLYINNNRFMKCLFNGCAHLTVFLQL